MDEAEWLACADPAVMWENLWYPTVPNHISSRVFVARKATAAQDRLLRLCGCAFCRYHPALGGDPAVQRSLELCEAAADDEPDEDAIEEAEARLEQLSGIPGEVDAAQRWRYATARGLLEPIDGLFWERLVGETGWESSTPEGRRLQADLLRDIFGNPFRRVALDPGWLSWDGGTVVRMARAIYDERRFADLPLLADALEDAGCTNAEILFHLRGPGPHVRGCWVVDLVLGKE